MIVVTTLLTVSLLVAQVEPQDKARVPDDSVEVTVVGCLKGRVLTTVIRRDVDVQRGPSVGERTFRVSGRREVMADVQRYNRQLVEVVGLVKRSALDDQGVKAGSVSISGGSPAVRSGNTPTGAENVPIIDVTSLSLRATSCRGN
jgi:hypothetical protein